MILDDYLACIKTASEKKKKSLFGGGGDSRVVVSDYASSSFYKMVPDNGVQVTATFTGTFAGLPTEKGTMFLPLGEEAISQRFKEILIQVAQDAKK